MHQYEHDYPKTVSHNFPFCLAKYAEAGVLYFNNPGNRPAGLTVQVLDPGSVTSLQTVSYINNRSGLKGAGVRRRGFQYASLVSQPPRARDLCYRVYFLTPSAFKPERTTA